MVEEIHEHVGYMQLQTYLRREGWEVNPKRILRLYREEGLSLRRRKPRRRRSAARREGRPAPVAANEFWAMDFMHDTFSSGETLRVLTAIDVHTWEHLRVRRGRSRPLGDRAVRARSRHPHG